MPTQRRASTSTESACTGDPLCLRHFRCPGPRQQLGRCLTLNLDAHRYGGLNVKNLDATHNMAPDKFILATEACNCGGVIYREPSIAEWWARAESLALDILEDLRYWAVGWTDWNLILSTAGGPNHLKNLCDANIIADPSNSLGMGTLIMQASFYYMGHFSRFIPAGSKRIAMQNSVETHAPPLSPGDVKNGQPMVFTSCNGNDVQKWKLDSTGSFSVRGTDKAIASDGYKHGGECLDVDMTNLVPKLQVGSPLRAMPGFSLNICTSRFHHAARKRQFCS